MSIRNKVFIIIFVLFSILGGANFLIQRFVIYPSFLQLEYSEAGENLKRIFYAIDREAVHLDGLCGDWAVWNDSYAFMEQQSEEYITNNLNDETLESIFLNLMIFCKPDGTIVWQHGMDWDEKKPLTFAFMTEGKIPANHPLFIAPDTDEEAKGAYGVFNSQFGPMLFSSRHILHSDGSGPSVGFLIMGRFFAESMQETLREQTRIPFDLVNPSSNSGPLCGMGEGETMKSGDLSFVALQDQAHISTCALYRDASGQPLFGVHYLFPREATRKGIASMRYASMMVIVSGVVVFVILGGLLQRIILRPLHNLTRHAAGIEQEGDYSVRLNLDRKDEIGSLANSFDSMVQTISERQEELKHANEQLTRMSMLDGLTGIANRRMFDQTLDKEWRRAMRAREPLSLILLDVDFFKNYNDTYGHQQGDQCLIAIANTLQEQVHRASDLVARYGGEEFAMVLPHSNAEGAMLLAKNACSAVQDLRIPHSASSVSPFVSISLGVITIVPQIENVDAGVNTLLEKADLALYQAKQQGRNRAIFSS